MNTFKLRPRLLPILRNYHCQRTTIPKLRQIQPTSPRNSYSTSSSPPEESLPKIAQSSVWTSMIPKFLRNRLSRTSQTPSVRNKPPASKEWNPASFYIIIFILIGSQSIRMIALKNDYAGYTRTTDAKIELLREVIEKVKRGEEVDVERLLGTGDEVKEREWEEVLREIEAEDSLWHRKSTESESKSPEKENQDVATAKNAKDNIDPSTSGTRTARDETQTPRINRPSRTANFY